jgi:hypothetical protein
VDGTHCRSLTLFGMTRGEGTAQVGAASGWNALQVPPRPIKTEIWMALNLCRVFGTRAGFPQALKVCPDIKKLMIP